MTGIVGMTKSISFLPPSGKFVRMIRSFSLTDWRTLLMPATLCILAIGCSNDTGNRITGNVTFDGKPVPAGKVYFMPDGAKGNTGSTGFADIVDGKYDTGAAGGRGAPTGAVKITVEGNDPSGVESGSSPDVTTKMLFVGYETTADIAEGATTHDIAVPAEAAVRPATSEGSAVVIP